MKNNYLKIILLLMLCSHAFAQQTSNCPNLLVKIDYNGKVISGSKAQLINSAQRGENLRVNWELDFDNDKKSDLVHWMDAGFVSVLGGEVFAQFQSIHSQSPSIKKSTVSLPTIFNKWYGLLGSNGILQGRFKSDKEVRETKVKSTWCSMTTPEPIWTAVYKNGTHGEDLSGSKEQLLNAIRAGKDMRIGWGLMREVNGNKKSIEHVTSPVFITIVDESEVVAQLPEHLAQKNYWNINKAEFDHAAVMWRGLISTTGSFDAIWVNRATGEEVRRSPQRGAFNWYVQQTPSKTSQSLAIKDGVIQDKKLK